MASGKKETAERPLHASLLFPELQRELAGSPSLVGGLRGLFVVTVFKKGTKREEWFLLFQGADAAPVISKTRPQLPTTVFPATSVEIEDQDLYKFVTGGLHGVKAFVENRVRIAGDLVLAQQLADVFVRAGGVEKAKAFLKRGSGGAKSKL